MAGRSGGLATGVALALIVAAWPSGAQMMTARDEEPSPFSLPEPDAGFETLSDFRLGNAVFRRLWTPAGIGSVSFDGLGPLFNARSCESCHERDGRGRAAKPDDRRDDRPSVLLKLGRPAGPVGIGTVPDPVYGHQLNDRAISGHRHEARVEVSYRIRQFTYPDGRVVELRRPEFTVVDSAHGALAADTVISARLPQQLIGLGLLERVPDAAILAAVDPDDVDADGISGRANRVFSRATGRPAIGRFGWKASEATVADQISVAFNRDMGIATPFDPAPGGDCTPAQVACLAAPDGRSEALESLEAHSALVGWITVYSSNLAVPAPRPLDGSTAERGAILFREVGCAACHRPSYTTGDDADQPHLGTREIAAYTDLLLHDMGPDLADGLAERAASGAEWRTAPLWGIGLTAAVNGNEFYLHDGRARTLEEAVLWHGGEAEAARDAFAGLETDDREALLDFVSAL